MAKTTYGALFSDLSWQGWWTVPHAVRRAWKSSRAWKRIARTIFPPTCNAPCMKSSSRHVCRAWISCRSMRCAHQFLATHMQCAAQGILVVCRATNIDFLLQHASCASLPCRAHAMRHTWNSHREQCVTHGFLAVQKCAVHVILASRSALCLVTRMAVFACLSYFVVRIL